ncbi:MAG: MFS transporter, partial [Hyphomicrobium denitrificans]|nr:MFS transporter [Hyphomicrobium denitrificans]
ASVVGFMVLGLALMGFTYGPLGTALSEPFPVGVRYTGASLAFNLAGIFGASLAPYVATTLATKFGIQAVGFYLTAASIITFLALWGISRHSQGVQTATLASQEQAG